MRSLYLKKRFALVLVLGLALPLVGMPDLARADEPAPEAPIAPMPPKPEPPLPDYSAPGAATLAASPTCLVAVSPLHGCLLTWMSGPGLNVSGTPSTKEGEACAWNLLRLVAMGDMRITTAMQNGGITNVSHVDHKTREVIGWYGIYSRYCTVVHGN
jgi:hypothetical protein